MDQQKSQRDTLLVLPLFPESWEKHVGKCNYFLPISSCVTERLFTELTIPTSASAHLFAARAKNIILFPLSLLNHVKVTHCGVFVL